MLHPRQTDLATSLYSKRGIPHWMEVEQMSLSEQMEIRCYKCVTLVPVIITFSVFFVLFIFYTFFYLYPSLKGDFFTTYGIREMWLTVDEMRAA